MSLQGLDEADWLSEQERQKLEEAVRYSLPAAYNFEILKTLRKLRQHQAKRVCLQFPEGLLLWAQSIALIIEEFADAVEDVFIFGDVTYGACCIDDIKARSLRADFIVHYAHSCLIPLDNVTIPCLYVFVDILISPEVMARNIASALPREVLFGDNQEQASDVSHVALLGTIQFSTALHKARDELAKHFPRDTVYIPQSPPLTPGETLGCTSPALSKATQQCIFIADGRFHMESAMIQNPHVKKWYRYDPFTKKLFTENFDMAQLKSQRIEAVNRAREATTVCIILSTLGRQGSVGLFESIESYAKNSGRQVTQALVPELTPAVLKMLAAEHGEHTAFINVGCPRLCLDWSKDFCSSPILTPYEAFVAFGSKSAYDGYHPMDYFAADGGPWSYHGRDRGNRDGSLSDAISSTSSSTGAPTTASSLPDQDDLSLFIASSPQTRRERLMKKWAERKTEMQNATIS